MHPEALGQSGLCVRNQPRTVSKGSQSASKRPHSRSIAAVERRDGRHGRYRQHGGSGVAAPSVAWAARASSPSALLASRALRAPRSVRSSPLSAPGQRPRSVAHCSAVNGVYIEVLGKGEPELLVLDGSQHR